VIYSLLRITKVSILYYKKKSKIIQFSEKIKENEQLMFPFLNKYQTIKVKLHFTNKKSMIYLSIIYIIMIVNNWIKTFKNLLRLIKKYFFISICIVLSYINFYLFELGKVIIITYL